MFAVLHIADFALHAVLRTEPDFTTDRPAALLDGEQKKAVLVACNAAARAQGVAAGQTAAQALAFCGALLLRTRAAAAEAEARATLLAAGFAISPRVESTADGICTTDLSGLDEARAQTLLAAAVEQLRKFGLPATGGMAATPLLALYAARSVEAGPDLASGPLATHPGASRHPSPEGNCSALPLEGRGPVARPARRGAARAQGPARPQKCIRVVHHSRAFLGPLPLAAADPGPELATILATWGIHTLGALTALSKADIARRLGPAGLALWERAAGETARVLKLVEPPREFVAMMEFENEVETLEPLLFILRRFIDRFALELDTAMLAAAELALRLELTDETHHARSFRLPEPTTRADVLFRTLHTHLEQLHTAASIRAVHLRVEPTRPPHRQQGLFETELRDPHGFAETLARVVAIVGSDRAGTPYAQDTHRPDAVVLESPAAVVPSSPREKIPGPGAKGQATPRGAHSLETWNLELGTCSRSELVPLGLPLRRLRPPVTARVEVQEGAPVSVWSAVVSDLIAEAHGPWRGAGDWWEAGRAWEREEWDVEVAGGGLFRLIRTAEGWFVEGEYD